MKGNKRAVFIALPLLAAAFLCLAGGAYARGTTDQALAVAVDGPGTVSDTGISCRDNESSSDCVELYADGTSVTLTATPDEGATFAGWGGDCSTATGATCTLTMNSAHAVTATFTSGGGGNPTLTVSVTGNGKVTGTGIDCGNGSTDCSESYTAGTPVTLTETPGTGATFGGWGGSCTGTTTTCTVSMNTSKSVTAAYSGGSASQIALSLTVTGSGRVTGPGISCGNGNTDCSELYAANTTVALTAAPDSGATFAGWGGSCSGAGTTCTLTMNTSKAVTASFTQGSTQKILTVSVGGSGRVTGTGINCGAGARDCSNAYNNNGAVTLIATPRNGATFLGWGGACTGTGRVCNLVMDQPKAVSASFSAPGSRARNTFAVRSLGRPIIQRTSVGWAVTLRFRTSRSAAALLRLTRNGRFVNAFTFSPRAGNVLVGPFNVSRAGAYRFRLTLTDGRGATAALIWNLCLASSRCDAFTPAASFVRSLGATVVRSGSGLMIKVRFRASGSGAATIRALVGGRVVSSSNFAFRAGVVIVDVPAGTTGTYAIVMNARNASGRTFQLRWAARI